MPTKCEGFDVEKLSLNCPMETGFCVTVNIPTLKKQDMYKFNNYHLHSYPSLNHLQIVRVQATGQDQNRGVQKIDSIDGSKVKLQLRLYVWKNVSNIQILTLTNR